MEFMMPAFSKVAGVGGSGNGVQRLSFACGGVHHALIRRHLAGPRLTTAAASNKGRGAQLSRHWWNLIGSGARPRGPLFGPAGHQSNV